MVGECGVASPVLNNPPTARIPARTTAISVSHDRREVDRFADAQSRSSVSHSLMTPTRNRITTTMTITPMIPTPPPLFISISR